MHVEVCVCRTGGVKTGRPDEHTTHPLLLLSDQCLRKCVCVFLGEGPFALKQAGVVQVCQRCRSDVCSCMYVCMYVRGKTRNVCVSTNTSVY